MKKRQNFDPKKNPILSACSPKKTTMINVVDNTLLVDNPLLTPAANKNNKNNNFNSDNNNGGLSPRLMSELSYEEQMKLAVLMSSETT